MPVTREVWTPAKRIADLRAVSLRPALTPAPSGSVSLAMGEPHFDTPAEIVKAAERALREGHTHYADQQGLPALRNALAARLPDEGTWSSDDVLITHGATAALAAVILATVGPGDRVVIPEPAYSLYADLVVLAGGAVDYVPLDRSLHWDLERLASALTDAAMFVFSNPSNPCGIVHTDEELHALARLLENTETMVVADEAYHRIIYPGYEFRSALDIEALRDRTVYVQTFSKTYAMTGWRVGYLVGPSPVVSAAAQVHRTLNGSVNTATQIAALRALELDDSVIEPMLEAYRNRRELVVEELDGVTGLTLVPPEGAFYGFVRYDIDVAATRVVEDLKERGVVVRAGSEYGPSGEGHVRISFAASEEGLRVGLDRMKAYFAASRESAPAKVPS
jgi:aspartate/methionine/tyrosine aminotransferase